MSKYLSLQIHPGKGLGFLVLGASLHDVLTRLKAQPDLYPTIDVSYSRPHPLVRPVILNLPPNGFRLRFDGPDQRLRLIEILDFGRTHFTYKNIDLVKLPEEPTLLPLSAGYPSQTGPVFRHVYNRLMGPTFPGEYVPPNEAAESETGMYVLSYPGIAFTFPLQDSVWSSSADFVSLLSSSAAAPAKSLAIFNGASWKEARQDLLTRPCLHPRSLALSMKGKEHQPDEVELVKVCGAGVLEMIRRSSAPFRIVLGETTPQDLVAELGPPDAIYHKNDHRLSIHKPRRREQRPSHGSYGASPARSEDFLDADHSSGHTTTDDSDVEDDTDQRDDDQGQATAKCFYNYFHHGFDVFISYPSNPSAPFPHARSPTNPPATSRAVDRLVATKVLLHGNVPGSYPFNRYRRSRWVIGREITGASVDLDSETTFAKLSHNLRNIWKGNYASDEAEKAAQNAIVLDRDWGDSPGSSYEVLEGWDDGEQKRKKGLVSPEGSGSGTTQIFASAPSTCQLSVLLKDYWANGDPEYLARVRSLVIPAKRTNPHAKTPQDFCLEANDISYQLHIPSGSIHMPNPTPRLFSSAWASTVLLPKSSFPPRALPNTNYLARCTDDLYDWQRHARKSATPFVLHDGPPFANGPLHLGHAVNKILKDINCRFELSRGKRVQYVPGWDCHGLPIEIKALEKQRYNGSIDPIQVRLAARLLASQAIVEQRDSFRQWGIMADWDNAWKTMDPDFELRQLDVFKSMVKAGLIHRRFKPVHWSPSSRTALAEAELEYREDHRSTAAYVKYPMKLHLGGKLSIVHALVWTTTPWTLPANRAIAVHADLNYCVIDASKYGRLLVARSTLEDVVKVALSGEDYSIIDNLLGKDLAGQTYHDPVFNVGGSPRPIFHATFVSDSTGTGLVHLAPGHGMEDYELCLEYGISAFAPVNSVGRFTSLALPTNPSALEGKFVLGEGSQAVLELIRSKGLLVDAHMYTHKYAYDWRTKQPIIQRATEQWFADVGRIQTSALESLNKVNFVPTSGKERLESFIRHRREWCISRQRAWGVPIPALYHKESGKAILTAESMDHIISVIKNRGTDSWWSDPEDDPQWVAPALRSEFHPSELRRGRDTMDVWFDSGTSWTQLMRPGGDPICPPADLYLEGTDQHRGWFQSSLLTYIARQTTESGVHNPKAPFKTLITHGFVLDEEGRKMSKSVGNVTSPTEIMTGSRLPLVRDRADAMGPDALRLWVASSDYTSDIKLNVEALKSTNVALAKYRTLFKFMLGATHDFTGPMIVDKSDLQVTHQIALCQLQHVFDRTFELYKRHEYNKAISEINRYVARDLSSFYLETVKDCLYLEQGEVRAQAQLTLTVILQGLQTMLGPVTPLLVEEAWDHSPKYVTENLPHPLRMRWDIQRKHLQQFNDTQLEKDLPVIHGALAAIQKASERARARKHMGSSLDCYVMLQVETTCGEWAAVADCFDRYLSELATLFVVSKVNVHIGQPPLHYWQAGWMESELFELDGVKLRAHVYKPDKAKCPRCWKYLAPVGFGSEDEKALCQRCTTVVQQLTRTNPNL
ncbi:MAG: hypothetical protein Q9202_007101 [Teloschistes flavicans]